MKRHHSPWQGSKHTHAGKFTFREELERTKKKNIARQSVQSLEARKQWTRKRGWELHVKNMKETQPEWTRQGWEMSRGRHGIIIALCLYAKQQQIRDEPWSQGNPGSSDTPWPNTETRPATKSGFHKGEISGGTDWKRFVSRWYHWLFKLIGIKDE